MKALEIQFKIEIANSRENLVHEMLGYFGGRLPEDIKTYMIQKAETERKEAARLTRTLMGS